MARLTSARNELRAAAAALAELRAAPDLDKLHGCWIKFVQDLERCWNKVRAEMKDNTKWQGWPERGRIEELRTTDPLLSYLRFARGVHEHGIAEITAKQLGGWALRSLTNYAHIERLEIKNGQIANLKTNSPMELLIQPAQLKLVPVVNRGVTYPVPTMHEGQPLRSVDPVTVAAAGLEFYTVALDQIAASFPG
jgi:hypothetical protein